MIYMITLLVHNFSDVFISVRVVCERPIHPMGRIWIMNFLLKLAVVKHAGYHLSSKLRYLSYVTCKTM